MDDKSVEDLSKKITPLANQIIMFLEDHNLEVCLLALAFSLGFVVNMAEDEDAAAELARHSLDKAIKFHREDEEDAKTQ